MEDIVSAKKKKILFLYNGGTVGLVPEKRGSDFVLVPPASSDVFKDACDPIINSLKNESEVVFEFVTSKDSTNMTPNDWERLIFRIKKAQDEEGYDAVAIAHGTDTLAYTSTALSLALHGRDPKSSGLRIPICITGAQNPIYEGGGDGKFNLENLFRVLSKAIDLGVADVLVSFWDKVFLGSRVLKISEKDFGAFDSPAFSPVGKIDARGVILNLNLLRKRVEAKEKLEIAPKFGRGIVSFELNPGTDPNVLLGFVTGGGVSALILKSLGEGNVCNKGQYNLLPLIKQASEDYMTPIFITTKFVGGSATSSHYETGYEAIKAGAIPCFDHTDVAVDVKVRWLIGNGMCSTIGDFREAMATSFAGEVTSHIA